MAVNSYREDEFMENTDKKKIFRRLFSYLLEYKAILIGVLLCMAVTVAISLVNPLLIEEAIDHYIANKDMKGLMGDSADNIPGVPGIGEKTAVKILTAFPTVEAAYEHLEEVEREQVEINLDDPKGD